MKNLLLSLVVGVAVLALYSYSFGSNNDDPNSKSECVCETCESGSSCSGSCDGDMSGCREMTEFKKEPMKMSSGMSMETVLTDETCPVSGETLGENPATFSYMGKEYKFCCKGCVAEFRQEPMDYVKETLVCPVEGGAAEKEVSAVYEGTKYYFCCAGCDKQFLDNPEKYMNGNSSEN